MAIFTGAIFPPDKNLRLGKDLSGGVSLTYSIAIAPGEDAGATIARTIEVLKRRVDPEGLFEISMVGRGRDRIEITMPLPNERVKSLRAAYEAALDDVGRLAIEDREFARLMGMESSAREAEITRLSQGSQTLGPDLREAARAADAGRDAARAVAAALTAGAPAEEINALAALKADADARFDEIRDRVLRSALTAEMVRQALALSDRASSLEDRATGRMVEVPSPRARAIEQLRSTYPEALPQLEEAIRRYADYTRERRTLDDPSDLVRMLRGAGVLTFRILVDPGEHPDEARLRSELREKGPANVASEDARWYRLNQPRNEYKTVQEFESLVSDPAAYLLARGYVGEEWGGDYWVLCWDVRGMRLTPLEGEWACRGAYQATDQQGRPAIGFSMDPRGATLLAQLSGSNIGRRMAVLLDDEVYTAPSLRAQISSSGIIEGVFTPSELAYIIRVLSAGSLQAKLSREPISQTTIGPELGMDNLRAGVRAGWMALIVVGVFMVVYYFLYGTVALLCLLCTALLILGAMSLQAAAFSLPGIAGIVLTFGMAVDANVLIFERAREELNAGRDLRSAVRLGYSKALSAIVDGNVTNLIVCVVLVLPGVATPEIKGFAITLGVGVIATLFSALVIGRLMFDLMIAGGVKRLRMLPTVFPVIDRVLTPRINWLRLRWIFAGISACYVGLGLGMVVLRGEKMLDTEFRGGTNVTVQFRPDDSGGLPTRAEVQGRIQEILARLDADQQALTRELQAIGESATLQQRADADAARRLYTAVQALTTADILPVNPRADGVTSDRFSIKSLATDASAVLEVVTTGFYGWKNEIDGRPAFPFAGSSIPVSEIRSAPVYPVLAARLGENIGDGRFRDDVTEYLGGVAIVLASFEPRPTLEDLVVSLEAMRQKTEFSSTLARTRDVRILDGTPDAVERAVVLVRDESLSFFDGEERWRAGVAQTEWTLAVEGLTAATTLAQVENFSPAVAGTIRAQAIAAVSLSFLLILIYCWVRFGSLRYSIGAIATSIHDCLTVLGLIALCEILYENPALSSIAQSVGLLPFKIDLNLIAAILTIIGYSLNDTIIVLDRIRENKGKLPYETDVIINNSINQTISRTVITSGTTLISALILYTFGGEGVRAFAFALAVGIGIGTYSSIAIAAPIVWSRKHGRIEQAQETPPPPGLPS